MSKKLFIFIYLIIIFLLSSCKKEKESSDDAHVDVFVKSILSDNKVVYGLCFQVIRLNATIDAVTAEGPDNKIYVLNENNVGNFLLEPSNYSQDFPNVGTYNFRVKFYDGIEKKKSDVLEDNCILPPNVTVTNTGGKVSVRWDPIPGSDYIKLIISKDGEYVLRPEYIDYLTSDNDDVRSIPVSWFTDIGHGTFIIELTIFDRNDKGIQSASSFTTHIDL